LALSTSPTRRSTRCSSGASSAALPSARVVIAHRRVAARAGDARLEVMVVAAYVARAVSVDAAARISLEG